MLQTFIRRPILSLVISIITILLGVLTYLILYPKKKSFLDDLFNFD